MFKRNKTLWSVLLLFLGFLQGCKKTTELESDPLGLFNDHIKESFTKIGAYPKAIEFNYVMEKCIESQKAIGHFQLICSETRALLAGRFKDFTNPAPQIRISFSSSELPGLQSSFLDCEEIK